MKPTKGSGRTLLEKVMSHAVILVLIVIVTPWCTTPSAPHVSPFWEFNYLRGHAINVLILIEKQEFSHFAPLFPLLFICKYLKGFDFFKG